MNPHALAAASGLPGYGPPQAHHGHNNGFGPAINQTSGALATVRISKYLAATKNNYGTEDTRVDAVLKHMTQVPNMSSVRYQGGQYIPDCTDKVSISPGIDACIAELHEEHNEIRRLTVVLTSRKKTVAQITEFIEDCDRAHQLEMSNKLANQLCVFEVPFFFQISFFVMRLTVALLLFANRLPVLFAASRRAARERKRAASGHEAEAASPPHLQQKRLHHQPHPGERLLRAAPQPPATPGLLPDPQGKQKAAFLVAFSPFPGKSRGVMVSIHQLHDLQSSALPAELTPLLVAARRIGTT